MVDAGTRSRRSVVFIAAFVAILILASPVLAEEEYDYEAEEELSESLGEAAWSIGAPLVGLYVAYRFLLRLDSRRVARILNPTLARRLHAITSIIFGSMALAHAYLNRSYATILEYALVSVLALTMVSGALLYVSGGLPPRGRRAVYRLHAQRILALILLILAAIHVSMRG